MIAPVLRNPLPPESRYELLVKIASGGMATVYVARLRAGQGVSRLVAVKRAHTHLTEDPIFRRMLVAEARLGAQIHHANVVAVQDVEELDDELVIVMDYIEGAALSELVPLDEDPAHRIACATRVALDTAAGLHAAHELRDEHDRPLGIIHRDISPHNLLVGLDGVTRVTDFGVAKSREGSIVTSTGAVRGKLAYMAPEYLGTGIGDRRIDVFALGIVLWETLTGTRLFKALTEPELVALVERCEVPPPSAVEPMVPQALDDVAMKALARDPAHRFSTAAAFREALERAARETGYLATHAEVAELVADRRREPLAARRAAIRAASAAPAAEATGTFTGEMARRDLEMTASIAAEPLSLGSEPTAAPTVARVPATSPARTRDPRTAPFAIGVTIASLLVIGWRLTRHTAEAPPPPPDAVVEAPTPAAPPSIVVLAPPPAPSAVPAPVPSSKRIRPRGTAHSTPSAEVPVLPAADKAKPNPYLN